MPGHAQPDRVRVLGPQGPVQAALVVGVRRLLAGKGGGLPIVDGGIHQFHGQVGALDQAHLDGGTAGRTPLLGPRGQILEDGERIRQVGLEHDSRL